MYSKAEHCRKCTFRFQIWKGVFCSGCETKPVLSSPGKISSHGSPGGPGCQPRLLHLFFLTYSCSCFVDNTITSLRHWGQSYPVFQLSPVLESVTTWSFRLALSPSLPDFFQRRHGNIWMRWRKASMSNTAIPQSHVLIESVSRRSVCCAFLLPLEGLGTLLEIGFPHPQSWRTDSTYSYLNLPCSWERKKPVEPEQNDAWTCRYMQIQLDTTRS